MTRIDNLFVVRLSNGRYVKMKTHPAHIGYTYIFEETDDLREAVTLLYPRVFSFPYKARALFSQQFKDFDFIPVEVRQTIKLKD